MHKFTTPGTLLELRALAKKYRRNVILFEPTPNGEVNIRDFVMEEGNHPEPLRIYHAPKDRHFDLIYTLLEAKVLAFCQGLIFRTLYKDVFKLPDVDYAVERMLYDPEGIHTLPLPDDPTKYKTACGQIFEFDKPEHTHCVLKDPRTCAFHNRIDFDIMVNENKDVIIIVNRSDGRMRIIRPTDGYLYRIDISCTRQLLLEFITPFPYKIAKSCDVTIYRNNEYEIFIICGKGLRWNCVSILINYE
jgi:OTU domain-containing protein 4